MTIWRAGTGTTQAPADIATAPFPFQPLLSSARDGEMTAVRAFVSPGVITRWHSHPGGQVLFVVDGVGLVQRDGGDVVEVRSGDCVWFAPGERHWHGATHDASFDYVSVQLVREGVTTVWMEPVEREAEAR